jgi:hypothetical protein
MMSGYNIPATLGALLPAYLWISALGKLLVKKGILTKAEIVSELQAVKNELPQNSARAELETEIDRMIQQAGKW